METNACIYTKIHASCPVIRMPTPEPPRRDEVQPHLFDGVGEPPRKQGLGTFATNVA